MTTYGGGSNPPVRLDPWQNIVGVKWRNDPPVGIGFQFFAAQPGFSSPIVPASPEYPARDSSLHSPSYLTAGTMFGGSTAQDGAPNYYEIRPIGGGDPALVVLSGANDFPTEEAPASVPYDAWAYAGLWPEGLTLRRATYSVAGAVVSVAFDFINGLAGDPTLRNINGLFLGARTYGTFTGPATAPGPSIDCSTVTAAEVGGSRNFVGAQLVLGTQPTPGSSPYFEISAQLLFAEV